MFYLGLNVLMCWRYDSSALSHQMSTRHKCQSTVVPNNVNSLAQGRCRSNANNNFQNQGWALTAKLSQVNATEPHYWEVNIGPGNGFDITWNKCWTKSMSPYGVTRPHWVHPLTHWGRDKMDAISQTTFSRAFSAMKIAAFWLNFHWNMFARVQLTIIEHWFRLWLGVDQATSHYLNQWW